MPTIQYTPDAGFFGADSFTYRVTNPDGGEDTAVVNVTVNDTEAPTIAITAPTASQEYPLGTTDITVTGTAADNDTVASVEVRLDGGSWLAATGTTSWTRSITGLADGGSYLLEARATDTAGNVSTIASVNFTVASDGTAPTVAITDPTGELPAGTTSYTVAGTASDNVSVTLVEVRVAGGSWVAATGTTSWTYELTGLTNGASVLVEARATDGESNVSTIASRTVTVNQAPTAVDNSTTTPQDTAVSIDVLANDLNVDAGATLTITVQASNGTATVVP